MYRALQHFYIDGLLYDYLSTINYTNKERAIRTLTEEAESSSEFFVKKIIDLSQKDNVNTENINGLNLITYD